MVRKDPFGHDHRGISQIADQVFSLLRTVEDALADRPFHHIPFFTVFLFFCPAVFFQDLIQLRPVNRL